MIEARWVVYAIVNRKNGKKYYGQTKGDIRRRWSKHLYAARHPKSQQSKISRAMRREGIKNFEVAGWLALGDKHQQRLTLNALERGIIRLTDATKNGYNAH